VREEKSTYERKIAIVYTNILFAVNTFSPAEFAISPRAEAEDRKSVCLLVCPPSKRESIK